MNEAKKILIRYPFPDKYFILFISYLAGDYSYLTHSQVMGQPLHIPISLNTSGAGFDHYDKLIHTRGCPASQMFQSSLCVRLLSAVSE